MGTAPTVVQAAVSKDSSTPAMVKGRERQPDPRDVCVVLASREQRDPGAGRQRPQRQCAPSSIPDSLGTHLTYTLDKQADNANATL